MALSGHQTSIVQLAWVGPSRGEVAGKAVLCPAAPCSPSRATAATAAPTTTLGTTVPGL